MKLEEIKKIAVIGAGLMEGQIAEMLSSLGDYEGNLVDISDELMTKGLQSMQDRLERFFVAKPKLTADEKLDILAR